MKATDKKDLNPLDNIETKRWFIASIVITIILLISLVYSLVFSIQMLIKFKDRELVVDRISREIFFQTDKMQLSVRISSYSGDLKWVDKYKESKNKLESNFEQLEKIVDSTQVLNKLYVIKESKKQINILDNLAFSSIRRGNRKEAIDILERWTYQKKTENITKSTYELVDILERQIVNQINKFELRMKVLFIVVILVILVLILLWTKTLKMWSIQMTRKENAEKALDKRLRELLRTKKKLQRVNGQLKEMSFIDGLTKIANRRKFDEVIKYTWQKALIRKEFISIIMLDIDFFKQYNDNYGHQAGDVCLVKIAKNLKNNIREKDFVARYGGEEFVLILRDTPEKEALKVAEKLRKSIENLQIKHEFSTVSNYVTVSGGVASMIPRKLFNLEKLVDLADQELYQVKREHRNKISSVTIE